jgi:predicted transcriptional regulator
LNLYEVASKVDARILTPTLDLSREVYCAYGADLLSDVLAFTRPHTLLLTGLFNLQVVRTAEVAELAGIIVVRGKTVDQSLLDLACASRIPILQTKLTMFESCGRLYQVGMLPCSKDVECVNNVCHPM